VFLFSYHSGLILKTTFVTANDVYILQIIFAFNSDETVGSILGYPYSMYFLIFISTPLYVNQTGALTQKQICAVV